MSEPTPSYVAYTVATALAEDVGTGDLTAQLLPADQTLTAAVITREAAVFCGRSWFDEVFRQLDARVQIEWHVNDGDRVKADQLLCRLQGPARALVTGERTALNFVQLLSGTATVTHAYAVALASTDCRILDTRKTVPGLRVAQKYAVRCGGGSNHRVGLYDAILIKENHIAAAGSITAAVQRAREVAANVLLEVEVENLDEFSEALSAGIDRVLLDNFDLEDMRRAVTRARLYPGKRVELEASGNVSLDNILEVARTGVDYISIGSLTKHVRAVDLSMRFEDKR